LVSYILVTMLQPHSLCHEGSCVCTWRHSLPQASSVLTPGSGVSLAALGCRAFIPPAESTLWKSGLEKACTPGNGLEAILVLDTGVCFRMRRG
jgi:hypothetical protein